MPRSTREPARAASTPTLNAEVLQILARIDTTIKSATQGANDSAAVATSLATSAGGEVRKLYDANLGLVDRYMKLAEACTQKDRRIAELESALAWEKNRDKAADVERERIKGQNARFAHTLNFIGNVATALMLRNAPGDKVRQAAGALINAASDEALEALATSAPAEWQALRDAMEAAEPTIPQSISTEIHEGATQ